MTTRKSNLSSSGRVASCASRTPIQRRHFACASIALGGAPSHASISSRSFRSAGRPACQSRALRWLTRINANQVRKWIVQHRAGRLSPNADVLPAPVLAKSESELNRASRCSAGVIEIELDRAHIRVRGAAVARNAASVCRRANRAAAGFVAFISIIRCTSTLLLASGDHRWLCLSPPASGWSFSRMITGVPSGIVGQRCLRGSTRANHTSSGRVVSSAGRRCSTRC